MPVDYHAWTHRPKGLGGTDPIETELPAFRIQQKSTEAQTITATAEMLFSTSTAVNRDASTFAYDTADPAGVLILRPGLYGVFAAQRVQSSYKAVDREIYTGVRELSAGVGAAIGAEFGESWFAAGAGQGISGLGQKPAGGHDKTVLNHLAIMPLTDPLTDPWRLVLINAYAGTTYVTSQGLRSALVVVRIGSY